MKKNVYIAVAAMMMMGAAGTANAAWTEGAPTLNVANESTAAAKGTQTPAATTTAGLTFALPALAQGSLVTISLTNGAKFKTDPKATNNTVAGRTLVLQGTAVGSATAVFSATNAAGITAADSITLLDATAGEVAIDVTGVPADGVVDITYKASTSNGAVSLVAATSLKATTANTTTFLGSDLVAMVPAVKSVTVTSAADVAQVANAYKDVNSAGTTVGNAAEITIKSDAPLAFANDSFLITLSGDFTGVKSITAVNTNKLTSTTSTGVDGKLDATAGTTVTDQYAINAAKTFAYARTVANPGTNGINYGFKVEYDGTTSQAVRNFQVKVDSLSTSGGTATLVNPIAAQAATDVTVITRNGTNYQLNLLTTSDSLVITNNDGATGAVTFVAKTAAGALITAAPAAGTPALPTTIAAGQTLTVLGSTLNANFAGLATLEINIEAADVNSQLIHVVPGVGASTTVLRTGTGNNAL